MALKNLNSFQKAIEMFEKAIKIDSKFVNAYYNKGISCIFLLGKSLYCLQRFEETLEAID